MGKYSEPETERSTLPLSEKVLRIHDELTFHIPS